DRFLAGCEGVREVGAEDQAVAGEAERPVFGRLGVFAALGGLGGPAGEDLLAQGFGEARPFAGGRGVGEPAGEVDLLSGAAVEGAVSGPVVRMRPTAEGAAGLLDDEEGGCGERRANGLVERAVGAECRDRTGEALHEFI